MRKLASIQIVNTVEPIANADAIERIRVLGWWVVSKKGEHQPGDKVVYCEIDSLLPERPEFEFLRTNCFKNAQTDPEGGVILPAGFRIKTVNSAARCLKASASRYRSCRRTPQTRKGLTSPTCSTFESGSRLPPSAWAGR